MGLGEMGLGELGLGEMGLGEMGQNPVLSTCIPLQQSTDHNNYSHHLQLYMGASGAIFY